jgi:predicted extracellular nuclease
MTMSRIKFVLATLALTGCLSAKNTDKGGGSEGTATIYDIQTGEIADGEIVTLSGVVATSAIALTGEGFFIQDPEGGEYSGLYVFLQGDFTEAYVAIGDEMNITGEVTEYYDLTELTITSPTAIEITGKGEITPELLDAEALVTPEPWEGVLVQFANQTVADCPNNYGEVNLSVGLLMDDMLYAYETDAGATYSSITGLLTYNWETWKVLPRTADDLAGYTAGMGCTVTVADIQQGNVAEGGVDLEGVVVTTGLTADAQGFYVQDDGGGEYSGIYVYLGDTIGPDLSVGDVVDISGSVVEYYDFTELSVTDGTDISLISSGATPVAVEISEAPADWESLEGVLTTWTGVSVETDAGYGEVTTNYGVNINDGFFEHGLSAGDFLDSATGVLSFGFEEFKLEPRSSGDQVVGEGGGGSGGDGGDGGTGGTTTEGTISGIQTGDIAEGTTVTLEGVTASSGWDANGKGFFVQDGTGMNSGLYIYTGNDGVAVEAGDVLTVTGAVTEYYDFTELTADVSDISVTGSGPIGITTLAVAPTDWEPYESVFIEISNVAMVSDATEYGDAETDWANLFIDDLFYDYDDIYGAGDSFSIVSGPVYFSYETFRICPRSSGDIVE